MNQIQDCWIVQLCCKEIEISPLNKLDLMEDSALAFFEEHLTETPRVLRKFGKKLGKRLRGIKEDYMRKALEGCEMDPEDTFSLPE